MAKPSRVAADVAKSYQDLRLLVIALCNKQGIDVDEVLSQNEAPITREQMKGMQAPSPDEFKPQMKVKK